MLFFFFVVRKCYCEGHCPDDRPNGTCEIRPGGQCFSAVEHVRDETGRLVEERNYGCLSADERSVMQVRILCIN